MATANAAERIKPVSSLGSVTLFHSFLHTPRTYLKRKNTSNEVLHNASQQLKRQILCQTAKSWTPGPATQGLGGWFEHRLILKTNKPVPRSADQSVSRYYRPWPRPRQAPPQQLIRRPPWRTVRMVILQRQRRILPTDAHSPRLLPRQTTARAARRLPQ
jgi:hypothetical protein